MKTQSKLTHINVLIASALPKKHLETFIHSLSFFTQKALIDKSTHLSIYQTLSKNETTEFRIQTTSIKDVASKRQKLFKRAVDNKSVFVFLFSYSDHSIDYIIGTFFREIELVTKVNHKTLCYILVAHVDEKIPKNVLTNQRRKFNEYKTIFKNRYCLEFSNSNLVSIAQIFHHIWKSFKIFSGQSTKFIFFKNSNNNLNFKFFNRKQKILKILQKNNKKERVNCVSLKGYDYRRTKSDSDIYRKKQMIKSKKEMEPSNSTNTNTIDDPTENDLLTTVSTVLSSEDSFIENDLSDLYDPDSIIEGDSFTFQSEISEEDVSLK